MFRSTDYRYDSEILILAATIVLVFIVIAVSAAVTACLSAAFFIVMLLVAVYANRSHHQSLMQKAYQVRPDNAPQLASISAACQKRLQPGPVQLYLVKSNILNAYTFGLGDPKVIVLYEPMLKVMSADELAFVIGHEMGHVALGHTWLNTILGGMAGIPAPFGAAVIMYAAFNWWNRACEFSADRAGMLACGSLNKAVSALVRLAAPNIRTETEFQQALTMIDAQDDTFVNQVAEMFQSHPMIIRRINQLKEYAKTSEYQRLQAGMNRNLSV